MCDQTEVSYRPGNVVWVKLNPVWWPGVVANSEEIPPDILKTLRKTPIAIVKFFQETEVFEYVHKLSNIYHYNCLRKNDFIRKGLDMYRSKNRDAPSNMKLFPADVARAEVLTGGDPNILNDERFQPEEKPTYADLFANTKKSPKKIKSSIKKKSSTQAVSQQSTVQRIITHPRFIKLNSGLQTDYEVRERKQEPVRAECDEEDNSPPTTYRCQDCDFTTIRLNVIVLHNKSHTRNYAKPAPNKASKRKNISAVRVQERSFGSERESLQKVEAVRSKMSDTNGTVPKARKKGRPRKVVQPSESPTVSVTAKTKEEKPSTGSRPSISKPKRSTPQKDAIQESLLEDWAEFETEQDNWENGDTSLESSIVETEENVSTSEGKTVNESHSAGKKDEFDFDETEEQLVIDKSKIRAGRKIPRVLEEKAEEVEKIETETAKKRKTFGVREKHKNVRTEVQEDKNKNPGVENLRRRRGSIKEDVKLETDLNSDNKNVRKRRTSSGSQRKSEDTKIENNQEIEKNFERQDGKKRKLSLTSTTFEKEVKVDDIEDIVEVRVEEEEVEIPRIAESSTEVEIEDVHEEIEVGGEIEIETENTIDDEQVSMASESITHDEETKNDSNENEAAEFSQKVDKLLQEVSVSSKLPELPQLLKKKHIKSSHNNTIMTEPNVDDDDHIIESISLINDDSSDGFDERKCPSQTGTTIETHVDKKHNSSCDRMRNSTPESADTGSIDNIEVTSDSSPEIVSVEMPTSVSKGFVKKKPPIIVSSTTMTTTASGKRPPVRFTMMSKLRNINPNNPNQVVKKSTSHLISDNTAKILKTVQQQKLQQSRARSLLKQDKPTDARVTTRTPALGQQAAAIHTSRSIAKSNSNKLIVVKPMSTQRPTTIDNIDLTGSRDPVVSSGPMLGATKSSRLTRPTFSRTVAGKMTMAKTTPKNVFVGSPRSIASTASTMKLMSSGNEATVPVHNQSEIITVNDDFDSNDNVQVEEISCIVDEAGNVIAESEDVCSTSKKEDILAKALQDTDVLQTEITLPSSSTILLDSCNIVQNSSSTTVYENVTLNTPPIMSSFETPSSRTINSSSPISEISEYIIIGGDADNM